MQWEAIVLLVLFGLQALLYLVGLFGGGWRLDIEPGGCFIALLITGGEIWMVLRLAGAL